MRVPLILLFLGAPALSAGQCPADLKLEQALFSTEIRDREPVAEVTSLPEGIPAVYFFTRVTGAAGTQIHHVWFYDNEEVVSVPLSVGGNDWRTWSSKNLGLRRSRDWAVQVTGPEDCVLGRWQLPAVTPGSKTLTRIRELMEAGDLAGARMETKEALAADPVPALREKLETILDRDLALARVEREIEQQSLYTARSRLDALLASSLSAPARERANKLDRQLKEAREALQKSSRGRLADLAGSLNATLAGGRLCTRLGNDLDKILAALLGADHPFLISDSVPAKAQLRAQLLDRRSGDSHELILSCLPYLLPHPPGAPPSDD